MMKLTTKLFLLLTILLFHCLDAKRSTKSTLEVNIKEGTECVDLKYDDLFSLVINQIEFQSQVKSLLNLFIGYALNTEKHTVCWGSFQSNELAQNGIPSFPTSKPLPLFYLKFNIDKDRNASFLLSKIVDEKNKPTLSIFRANKAFFLLLPNTEIGHKLELATTAAKAFNKSKGDSITFAASKENIFSTGANAYEITLMDETDFVYKNKLGNVFIDFQGTSELELGMDVLLFELRNYERLSMTFAGKMSATVSLIKNPKEKDLYNISSINTLFSNFRGKYEDLFLRLDGTFKLPLRRITGILPDLEFNVDDKGFIVSNDKIDDNHNNHGVYFRNTVKLDLGQKSFLKSLISLFKDNFKKKNFEFTFSQGKDTQVELELVVRQDYLGFSINFGDTNKKIACKFRPGHGDSEVGNILTCNFKITKDLQTWITIESVDNYYVFSDTQMFLNEKEGKDQEHLKYSQMQLDKMIEDSY